VSSENVLKVRAGTAPDKGIGFMKGFESVPQELSEKRVDNKFPQNEMLQRRRK
jgi:hypothetical protein